MKCSLTARAIFSGCFLGQFLGLQFQAMRTTGSGPTSEQGVLCPQSSLYLSTLSLSLFTFFPTDEKQRWEEAERREE